MALTEQNRAKRFKLYKNGDTQFSGKEFVLNRRRIRTWDSFLQAVTTDTRCCQAVRSIRTPVGGTRIENLDQLQDKNNYVAVESGRFKRMGYLQLSESFSKKSPRLADGVKPVEHSRLQVSARHRKVPTNVLTIFVYPNGRLLEPARRLTLTNTQLRNWESILLFITDRVNLASACRKLFNIDGTPVSGPADLCPMGQYVAVGGEVGGFKKLEYGMNRKPFNSSPKRDRKLNPIDYPKKRGSNRSSYNSSDSNQTSANTSSNKSSPSVPPGARIRPIRREPKKPSESEGPFHARPVKHKRSSEKDRPKEVDYDRDEGGIFKAKPATKQDAEVIEDTKETKVDVPIDQMKAEEVVDEEIDDVSPTPHAASLKQRTPTPKKSPSPVPKSATPPPAKHKSPTPPPPKSATPVRDPTPGVEKSPTPREKTPELMGETPREEPDAKPEEDKDAAAAKIQAGYRGYVSRQEVAKEKKVKEEKNDAATKIQAGYRGYNTRKQLQEGESKEEEEAKEEAKEEERAASVAEEEEVKQSDSAPQPTPPSLEPDPRPVTDEEKSLRSAVEITEAQKASPTVEYTDENSDKGTPTPPGAAQEQAKSEDPAGEQEMTEREQSPAGGDAAL